MFIDGASDFIFLKIASFMSHVKKTSHSCLWFNIINGLSIRRKTAPRWQMHYFTPVERALQNKQNLIVIRNDSNLNISAVVFVSNFVFIFLRCLC